MKRLAAISATLLLAMAAATGGARALTLEFPAMAAEIGARSAPLDSYFLATEGYRDGRALHGIVAEGALRQESWRIGTGGLTTLQLMSPLRDQLVAAGYEVLFECAARACGGFDFRFRLDVLPEPDMHVNLADFRYVAARRAGAPDLRDEYASLLVSRSANAGFVQLTRIGAPAEGLVASTKTPDPGAALPAIGERLERQGFAVLDDLRFSSGSARLGAGDYASLEGLAAYLQAVPSARVTLVGHTDAEGALGGNIALSRRRAEAVADALVARYGIDRARVAADGVGFLAPRFSNLTETGRMRNRRVEAVLTTTE